MLRNLRKILENFRNSGKVIFRCFYYFLNFLENLQKSLESFGKLQKRFKNVFFNVPIFKIFGKSLEIFRSVQKLLENFWM